MIKKILFILLATNACFSQAYLNESSIWYETQVSCPPIGLCFSEDYTITLPGDTVINNIEYFKTLKEGTETVTDWVADSIVAINDIYTFLNPIREENGKLYEFNRFTEKEELLHDFNLMLGDTAIGSNGCINPQIVEEIDTLMLGNEIRKRFIFNPPVSFIKSPLIEGIGTSRGLFVKPCSGTIGIESGSSLLCYSQNGNTVQISDHGNCSTTSINNQAWLNDIEVFPNPFSDYIEIKNIDSNEILSCALYDISGQLVLSEYRFEDLSQIRIQTSGMKSGVYILMIKFKSGYKYIKLVK